MDGCESQVSLAALQPRPSCLRKRKARTAHPATLPWGFVVPGQKDSSSGLDSVSKVRMATLVEITAACKDARPNHAGGTVFRLRRRVLRLVSGAARIARRADRGVAPHLIAMPAQCVLGHALQWATNAAASVECAPRTISLSI